VAKVGPLLVFEIDGAYDDMAGYRNVQAAAKEYAK
jgi:hypothetical protein